MTDCMLLGDGFWEVCEEYGGMHSMTILWEVLYLTTDANIIKARSRMLEHLVNHSNQTTGDVNYPIR